LELVAGQNAVPLAGLVRFGAEGYSVVAKRSGNWWMRRQPGDQPLHPSNARREARKLDTQALHERWRKEYRALKQRRPGMSGVWYSEQIAKNGNYPQRSAETIRKHMTRQKSWAEFFRPTCSPANHCIRAEFRRCSAGPLALRCVPSTNNAGKRGRLPTDAVRSGLSSPKSHRLGFVLSGTESLRENRK
jgi:hypothetical protein